MTGLSSLGCFDEIWADNNILEAGLNSLTLNFTPPKDFKKFSLKRILKEKDLTNNEMVMMPGFRLSWHYTGLGDNVTTDSRYSKNRDSKLFIG